MVSIHPAEDIRDVLVEIQRMAPQIKEEIVKVFREIEDIGRNLLLKQVEKVWTETREDLRSRLVQIEDDINGLIYTIIQNLKNVPLQQININAETIEKNPETISQVVKTSENLWHLVTEIPVDIVSMGQVPSAMREFGNYLYRAQRFDDAIKWYSRALTATMYPPSAPSNEQNLPEYGILEHLPFGAFYMTSHDVDDDNQREIIYVPSRELGAIKVSSIIINKGGIPWPKLQNLKGISVPLVGNFENSKYLIANWSSPLLLDCKFYSPEKENIPIIRGDDRSYSVATYGVESADINGDKFSELIIFTYRPAGISVYKLKDNNLEELGTIMLGQVCNYVIADIDGDESNEIITVNKNGQISIIEMRKEAGLQIRRIPEKLSNPLGVMFTKGRFESSKDSVFLSCNDGIFEIAYGENEYNAIRLSNKRAFAIGTIKVKDTPYLFVLTSKNGALMGELYTLSEVLGVKSLKKVKEIPIATYEPIRLEPSSGMCSPTFCHSRNYVISEDIDGDNATELFIGLDKIVISIDFRF